MALTDNLNQTMREFGTTSMHRGTSLTVGYRKRQNDRAVRRFLVNTTTNNPQTLGDAVVLAVAFAGSFHPTIIDLPLQKVRAFRFGPQKVICDVVYQRDRFSTPPFDAFNSASWRGAFEGIPVYRSKIGHVDGLPVTMIDPDTGLPEGDWLGASRKNKSTSPQPAPFKLPILKLYVQTVLNRNPLLIDTDLFRWKNTTNQDTIVFGGVTFPENTVRFDDIAIDFTQRGGGGDLWSVTYEFSARRGGWVGPDVVWNETDEDGEPDYTGFPPNEWIMPKIDAGDGELVYPDMYTRNIFQGHFPVHTP